jgi:hypothetical protein
LVSHPATNFNSDMASIAGSISVPPTPTPTIANPNCRFAVIRTVLFSLALSLFFDHDSGILLQHIAIFDSGVMQQVSKRKR